MAIKPSPESGRDLIRCANSLWGFPRTENHGNYSVQPQHLHTCLGEQCSYMNLYDGNMLGGNHDPEVQQPVRTGQNTGMR